MGMIDRTMARFGYERRNDAADPSWSAIAPGIGYPAALSARASENLSAVLACVTAISSALAYVPALIYRQEGGSRVEVQNHPVRRLSRLGVNEHSTWPDFLDHLVASALLTGNGLATIDRDGQRPARRLDVDPLGDGDGPAPQERAARL